MDAIASTLHQPLRSHPLISQPDILQPNLSLPKAVPADEALPYRTPFRRPADCRLANGASQPEVGDLLIESARPLLNLMVNIRQQYQPEQDSGLYRQVADEIQQLEAQLNTLGIDSHTWVDFRYALCCALDEAVMSQPWGHQGVWAGYSLLTRFHNESWGGERFFIRLSELMTDPERHRSVLRFFLLCLDLGYEGRYRVLPQGEVALQRLRQRLHQQLYPTSSASCALHLISPPQPKQHHAEAPLSLLLYALALVLILTLVFLCYHQSLSQQSQQILQLLMASLAAGSPL